MEPHLPESLGIKVWLSPRWLCPVIPYCCVQLEYSCSFLLGDSFEMQITRGIRFLSGLSILAFHLFLGYNDKPNLGKLAEYLFFCGLLSSVICYYSGKVSEGRCGGSHHPCIFFMLALISPVPPTKQFWF